MDIAPACEAAKLLGHSWPGLHWWLTLTAADQGAWFSGLGALAAVAATLFLAWLAERRRRLELRQRTEAAERIFAMRLQRPLTMIGTDLGNAAHGVRRLERGHAAGAVELLKVQGLPELAELTRRAEDSAIASPELVAALVAVETAVESHNRTVERLGPLIEDLEGEEAVSELAPFPKRTLTIAKQAVRRAIDMFGKHDARLASLVYAIGEDMPD